MVNTTVKLMPHVVDNSSIFAEQVSALTILHANDVSYASTREMISTICQNVVLMNPKCFTLEVVDRLMKQAEQTPTTDM